MVAAPHRVAFVSRELAPFGGGGIGPYVRAAADLLAEEFEVVVFTTSRHRAAHDRLSSRHPQSLPKARIVFVDEPRSWDGRNAYNLLQAWSANVYTAIQREYGERGPDLIEFPDFLGEGCVTVQAKRTAAAWLAETTIAVRAYGTAEIYDVLDGFLPRERERAFTYQLERYALRFADLVAAAGGDIRGTFERFYGADGLAESFALRHPFAWEGETPAAISGPGEGPLRLLYFGRLERRKGVRNLVNALTGLDQGEWQLTIVGADTETAPLGRSMYDLLALEIAGDPRIELGEPVARDAVPALIDAHDLVVIPSLWECWPNVALEALQRGRPLLATPTGGLTEIVEPGVSGWLSEGTSAAELATALGGLIADPRRVRELETSGVPRERFSALTDPEAVIDGYCELFKRAGAETAVAISPAADDRLVSVVIPYFEMERWINEAVDSVHAQTHASTEIVIVNDGSLRREDAVLLELAEQEGVTVVTQPNSGLGEARNFGIAVSHGEFVVPLDADNVLEPEFIARALAALAAAPELAYVTSWLRYIDEQGGPWKGTDEGLKPIGNSSAYVEIHNVAGDATAVFRRRVFDRLRYSADVAGFEDWALYREMRRLGEIGHVIPEPLINYRVRDDSMMRDLSSPREQWLEQAIDAHLRESEVRWTAEPN